MERKFRVSGFMRQSKNIKYPICNRELFDNIDSAANVCKTIIDGYYKRHSSECYKTSIEGHFALASNTFDFAASYSAVSHDHTEVLITLYIYPVDEVSGKFYTYRSMDINFDGKYFHVGSSCFEFDSYATLEECLLFIDHFTFECLLQNNINDEG